jgi:hypothetical protein
MKAASATLALVALLALGTICQAGVVGYAADDGDGAIVCNCNWLAPGSGGEDAGTMLIQGNQYGTVGHIGPHITTEELNDSARFVVDGDPTVKLHTIIDNDTTFAWTAYHVNIYMDQPFTISAVSANYGDTSEPGWWGNATVATAVLIAGKYVGQVDYYGGTPIQNGESLDFSYKVTFDGTVHFCQEMIPVPEPASLVLVLSGLMGLLVVRRKFAK